jgi:DNA-binding SARP family transcriptional activator
MSSSRRQRFDAVRSDPDALASLIESAIDEGSADEAVEWSEHLSRIDPDRVRRYMLHARTLAAAGQVSKAEKVIERYEQLFAEDAESLTARAEIALRRQLGATQNGKQNY